MPANGRWDLIGRLKVKLLLSYEIPRNIKFISQVIYYLLFTAVVTHADRMVPSCIAFSTAQQQVDN